MSSKNLDKFYTNYLAACTFIDWVRTFVDLDSFDNIIEPSAGAGALLNHLPARTMRIDLMPERDDITQCDFFDFQYPLGKNITVGNPPFGSRSKLAIEFFKKAAEHSEAIAFIIPVTWEKYSIHKQLPEGWALVGSERLPEMSFELDGKPYRVRCCMQMWIKQVDTCHRINQAPRTSHPDFDMWQYNNTPESLKVFKEDFDFAVPRQGWADYSRREVDEVACERTTQWALFKASTPEVLNKLMKMDFDALSKRNTQTPGFGKADVVLEYLNIRKIIPEITTHADFKFVTKDECWDVAVYQSPPKTILYGEEVKRTSIYLKCKGQSVIDTFTSIRWQDKVNMYIIDGTKIPGVSPYHIIEVYNSVMNLRLTSQPSGINPWFDFVRADACEFAIRQAYPKTVAKEDIDGQSHYFIKPKVAGVREVFDSFNWQDEEGKKMLGGASVPCLDKDTVVKFYVKYMNNITEADTHSDLQKT